MNTRAIMFCVAWVLLLVLLLPLLLPMHIFQDHVVKPLLTL
jgi:hypothetical protein